MFKVLIGNKNDMEDERQVSTEEGQQFADTHGMVFIETSAKSDTGVGLAFRQMAEAVMKKEKESTLQERDPKVINLDDKSNKIAKKERWRAK